MHFTRKSKKTTITTLIALLVLASAGVLGACEKKPGNAVTTPAAVDVTPTEGTVQETTPVPETTPTETPEPTVTPTPTPTAFPETRFTRQAEDLGRGLVAVNTGKGIFLSWRFLGTDPQDITFSLYRNGTLIAENLSGATNFLDKDGKPGDAYGITSSLYPFSSSFEGTAQATEKAYIEIPLNRPADDSLMQGQTCSYYPNDASVADLDGDGEYEIILKWDPDNSKDNSQGGITGRCYLDAYKLDGTFMWRINLGINIRAGAHYTQFMVYDFDGDGKAEMICKTSDGSVDGKGNDIGDPSKIYLNTTTGKIMRGNEYLTLFDGETGEALDTIDFEPARGSMQSWGDDYANRSERYLGAVAYLDGKTPTCIMSRGYYARTAIAAYDVVDKKLVMRWKFDTNDSDDYKKFGGQGNHNLAVADVDGDGYDELCFGQLTIDQDGTPLSCTFLGHGDAMHVGDLVLSHQGIEAWGCLEATYGGVLWFPYDATILYRVNGKKDTGRGAAGNFVAGNDSYEFATSDSTDIYDWEGNVLGTWPKGASVNYAVYWDADLEHEVGDGTKVYSIDGKVIFNAEGCTKINGTKSNTSITADFLGDWREEIMLPTADGTALRIYVSTDITDVRLFTLMHDIQYRCQVASQNVAYNQGALTSFFLGTGYPLPKMPDIYLAGKGE